MTLKRNYFIFLLLILNYSVYGQERLIHSDDEESISIKKITANSTILGDLGVTEYTVEVFNNSERVLSGELQFPLSDRQTIIGYSLDIEGVLRAAVAVDKAKGRAAFENIVSRSVDPGLIEKTEGNNFKTRIYPIPANGSRIIQLTILDKLIWDQGIIRFTLPVNFKEKIEEKEVHIDFVGFSEQLQLSGIDSFDSKKEEGKFLLQSKTVKEVDIKIIPFKKAFSYYQNIDDDFYYYSTIPFVKKQKIRKSPKSMTVLWDHSRSRKGLVNAEIDFLKMLVVKLQNVKINFVLFNSGVSVSKNITVRNGRVKKLEKFLNSIHYDGATQYGSITKIPEADMTLLFSDGLSNFGDTSIKNTGTILHTITSQASGNYAYLKAIAVAHGGAYINLQNKTLSLSVSELLEEAILFSGFKESELQMYYPKQHTRISNSRLVAIAKGAYSKTIAPLINNKLDTLPVVTPLKIDRSVINLERLFAIEKLSSLHFYPEKNKEEITSLGLQYQLLTEHTSLIVLEEIEDYIKNEIVPPTPELQKIYFSNLELAKLERKEEKLDVFEEQTESLQELLEWRFPEKQEELDVFFENLEKSIEDKEEMYDNNKEKLEDFLAAKNALLNANTVAPIIDKNYEEPSPNDPIIKITVTPIDDLYLVEGVVGEDGEYPMPGVNIVSQLQNIGTVTDFDGRFTLKVPHNTVLKYSFLGFQNVEQTITLGTHQIDMPADNLALDEVVMVANFVKKILYKDKNDFLENAPNIDDYQVFNYNKELIVKKKNAHIILGESPLVFVDYEPEDFKTIDWKDGEDELRYLDWDEIFSLEIIPVDMGEKLTGDIAKDGIIFAYTKDFVEDDAISIPIHYNKHIAHELSKKVWENIPESLLKIKKYKPERRYKEYLKLVASEEQPVGFYMAAGTIFKEDAPELAVKIWSNIAEIQLDNHENMRTLGYLLRATGYYTEAIPIFQKILALRPDEPIAYRDLAVTYELNKEYLKAINILNDAAAGNWIERNRDPYDYVEVLNTLYNDYNAIAVKGKPTKKEKYIVTADLRVVLNWTSSDTDIDLHLVTPSGEDYYYSNDESENARYNTDITQGFGPEEILIKKAEKGTYKVLIDFYADRQQTIHGPVGVSIEIYKYFGTDKEERIEKVLTLTKEEDDVLGALIQF